MTHFGAIRWANDPQHIASRFRDYRRIMEHWRAVLPVPLLEIDYEETVADLEGVARRLVAWCGLLGAEVPGVSRGETASQDGKRRPGSASLVYGYIGGKVEALRGSPSAHSSPAWKSESPCLSIWSAVIYQAFSRPY